ncbi:unnamed protein product [Chondrus crispus]|uniref:Uncharacterized protein n=1 Tax=Chondrus crispus TaxID=2769 RepID=R7QDM8_CHOCR|nr:unnamed protein product [Chondrus crispus]CDF36194.1 unnamed protein product [Chondrus crispus]|eukprot:XP_005716013.1 unnamed protein product [Chondrus crispus]
MPVWSTEGFQMYNNSSLMLQNRTKSSSRNAFVLKIPFHLHRAWLCNTCSTVPLPRMTAIVG